MKMLLGLISLLTMGCAVGEPAYILNIDEELKPYLDVFVSEGRSRGRNINIENLVMIFSKLPEKDGNMTLGQCVYGVNGNTPIIRIDTEFWKWAAPETREQVLFHEFGHCVLDRRGHIDDSTTVEGEIVPRSIMSTMLFSDYYYRKFRKYYVDELFAGSNHL